MSRAEYHYCPLCATPLQMRRVYQQLRPACPACSFVHFADPKVAVIALVTHADKVLVIRRAVDPARGKWALPGGYMDAGEMPEAALQRELNEELRLAVCVVRLLEIFPMVVSSGHSRGIVLAYHAVPADADQTLLTCDDDVSEAGWFAADQVPTDLAFASTHDLLARWRTHEFSETTPHPRPLS
ncbi:MAG: NUDIX hydrolase [Chloroflexota bacterium]|nr:NUDIX hydrolase [Chloroflexota bacterium]